MSKLQQFLSEKTREEFLAYGKGFENRIMESEGEAITANERLVQMLAHYGFAFKESFNMRCRDFSGKKKNTSNFYRLPVGEHGYIEVQIGYIEQTRTSSMWSNSKHRTVVTYTKTGKTIGVFRVCDHSTPDLNPATGRPWKVGDHDSSGYGRTLTANGWYTGD